ncbi:hypothetical protein F5880DRAFT_1449498, partial [Lentinula raphanica]
ISRALSDAKECDKPFGGLNIIFAGDFAQLSPVGDVSLCSRIRTEGVSTTVGQNMVFGKLLWLSVKTVVILSEITRQTGAKNKELVSLLSRLRFGQCNERDFDLLNSRLASVVCPDWSDNTWSTTPLIVCNNDTKDVLNARMAAAFAERTQQELHWYIASN